MICLYRETNAVKLVAVLVSLQHLNWLDGRITLWITSEIDKRRRDSRRLGARQKSYLEEAAMCASVVHNVYRHFSGVRLHNPTP
jgi:hypothetical protein